ncbi:hypothetical protein RCH15_001838 [Arthrobacter sp. MP_M4]|nr:hypothetical protein [Arthrobacter sp. MP_M4]
MAFSTIGAGAVACGFVAGTTGAGATEAEVVGDGRGDGVVDAAGAVAGPLAGGWDVAEAGAAESPVRDAADMSAAARYVAIIRLRFIVSFKNAVPGATGRGPGRETGKCRQSRERSGTVPRNDAEPAHYFCWVKNSCANGG